MLLAISVLSVFVLYKLFYFLLVTIILPYTPPLALFFPTYIGIFTLCILKKALKAYLEKL